MGDQLSLTPTHSSSLRPQHDTTHLNGFSNTTTDTQTSSQMRIHRFKIAHSNSNDMVAWHTVHVHTLALVALLCESPTGEKAERQHVMIEWVHKCMDLQHQRHTPMNLAVSIYCCSALLISHSKCKQWPIMAHNTMHIIHVVCVQSTHVLCECDASI